MFQTHQRALENLIALCDLIIIVASVLVGSSLVLPNLGLSQGSLEATAPQLVAQSGPALIAWLVMAWRLEFYQSRRTQTFSRELVTLAEVLLFSVGTAAVFGLSIFGALVFDPLVTWTTAFLGITLLRLGVRGALRRARNLGHDFRRVVIVGGGRMAAEIGRRLRQNPHFGVHVVGAFRFADPSAEPLEGVPDLGDVTGFRSVLRDVPVDFVITCPALQASSREVQWIFDACHEAGIQCYFAPDFLSMENRRTTVAWFGDVPTLTFHSGGGGPLRFGVKRLMDIFGALLGIGLGLPAILACAVAVKLQDGGAILFRQRRVGKDGRLFYCLKFRSMCSGADAQKDALADQNEAEGPVFKIANDPRVTPIGRFMRKYSLDELPQFFNVLVGDMSLVGPRPPTPSEVAHYEWWQRRRISVSPGLTCVWQVWGRNKVSFRRWVEMDLYYIDNWSLWLDVKLIFLTARSVFSGTGM